MKGSLTGGLSNMLNFKAKFMLELNNVLHLQFELKSEENNYIINKPYARGESGLYTGPSSSLKN